jgi:Ca-activated chloride channel homolog
MKRKLFLLFFSVLFLGLTTEIFAVGALFTRPLRSTTTYQMMWIKKVDVNTTIQDQIAATHMDQTFFNDMNVQVEAVFVFPLPENAVITELVYWFNGQRYVAEVRERQEAINDYNNKIRQYLDPALLEYLGDNLFRLRIAPINAKSDVRFEITYTELLPYDFGLVKYSHFLKTNELSPKPLERVSLNIDAKSQTPYKYFGSPSHEQSTATKITKISDSQYEVIFGDENFYPDRDFKLEFETVREGINMNMLTYTPVPADSFGADSFYALWITPPDSIAPDEEIPKNVVFVADVSSSMEGLRIQQLKESIGQFLNHLQPKDSFNIISFGTSVVPFEQDLVGASPENITQANSFVFQMAAAGLTNIDLALETALAQSFQDSTFNIIIFLTDGYPTWGELNIENIVQNTNSRNEKNVRVFTFGVGEDISKLLLIRVARENGGYPTFITQDDSIAWIIDRHFKRISKPVLSNLEILTPGLNNWDRFPKILPDLFWGSQVLEMGLYTNSNEINVTLNGKIKADSVGFTKELYFPDTLGGFRFVPRLWARDKINYLYEQIEIYGEQEELKNQIIDLSIRFGILTSYTALYSDPTDPTGVNDKNEGVTPNNFTLKQNYPNPFNAETEISYYLPAGKQNYPVKLMIYDLLGRLIKILELDNKSPGYHSVVWDGTDDLGNAVPSGVYVYVLQVGDFKDSKKLVLMR